MPNGWWTLPPLYMILVPEQVQYLSYKRHVIVCRDPSCSIFLEEPAQFELSLGLRTPT